MLTRCIFCHRPFPHNGSLSHLRTGRGFAHDPDRGRLWIVCANCRRWNLCPIEDRGEALEELARLTRDRGRLMANTDNISLLEVEGLPVVRVGAAGLEERSWWRYGREFLRRRASYKSPKSLLTAYAYGAMAYLSESIGLNDHHMSIRWDDTLTSYILRWRRFGWAAWFGRVPCPNCRSVVRALRFDSSWWLYPRIEESGEVSLGVPCPRCDPWTPDKVCHLDGPEAVNVLRRVLAYQHIAGATRGTVLAAVKEIEDAGSTEEFTKSVASGEAPLRQLPIARSIALEIALNEAVERQMMAQELKALEFMWKREEELARIIDEELSHSGVWQRHIQRIPRGIVPPRKL